MRNSRWGDTWWNSNRRIQKICQKEEHQAYTTIIYISMCFQFPKKIDLILKAVQLLLLVGGNSLARRIIDEPGIAIYSCTYLLGTTFHLGGSQSSITSTVHSSMKTCLVIVLVNHYKMVQH